MWGEYVYLDTYGAENELDTIEAFKELADEEEVRKRIQKVLIEVETAKNKLDEIERRCKIVLASAARHRKTVEEALVEVREIEREIEERQRIKLIPEKEAITVAISRLPNATDKVKEKAARIIEKYDLTESDVDRIYRYYFGE